MTAFVSDSFTGSAGTALASHSGETGATWAKHPINSSSDIVISNANRVRPNIAGAQGSFYYASGSPKNANYYVEALLRVVSLPVSGYAGVAGRMPVAANDFYFAIYNIGAGGWQLWGNGVQLGTTYAQTLTVGVDYTLRLDMKGPRIALLVNGVVRVFVDDAVTKNAGKAGVAAYGAFTDSTGMHVDNISADRAWTKNVICDGDSITYGNGVSAGSEYPSVLGQLLGSDFSVVNLGVPAQTLVNMEADAATQIDPQYDASYSANIIVCLGGTNDLYFNASAATAETSLQTYCTNRRSAGFKVIVCTILPRGDFPGTSTLPSDKHENHSIRRKSFNAWVRANYRTFSDALADIALDYELSDSYDADVYQSDRVHPNATGAAKIAAIVKKEIGRVLSGHIAGTVEDADGNPASRTVRAYREDGEFAGSAISDPVTGAFSIKSVDGTPHHAVCFPVSSSENALVFDSITPL